MGIFLTFTALTVLIPLQAEIRAADRDVRELISPSLMALGLLTAGLGLWLGPDAREATIAGIGIVIACAGLLLRPSGVGPAPPQVPATSPATPSVVPASQEGSST